MKNLNYELMTIYKYISINDISFFNVWLTQSDTDTVKIYSIDTERIIGLILQDQIKNIHIPEEVNNDK